MDHHNLDDPRIVFRQIPAVLTACSSANAVMLKGTRVLSPQQIDRRADNSRHLVPSSLDRGKNKWYGRYISWARHRFARTMSLPVSVVLRLTRVYSASPDVIQASDARELPFAVVAKLLIGCRLVYDSHEDYFRQAVDYSRIRPLGFGKGLFLRLLELLFVRCANHVYCTDDFLYSLYRQPRFGACRVSLLRNFPPVSALAWPQRSVRASRDPNVLQLVYVGSVNRHRGLLETASFVEQFNQSHDSPQLTFTIFSHPHYIVDRLSESMAVVRGNWQAYPDLMETLPAYDIGICLWQDIKKFHRNLPIKNFDYMAACIPFVTSNFGLLAQYALESGGGICINPSSYEEFQDAMLALADQSVRYHTAMRGHGFVSTQANFEAESSEYVEFLTKISATG